MIKKLENWLQEECEKEHIKYIQSIMKSANVSAEKATEMLAINKKL